MLKEIWKWLTAYEDGSKIRAYPYTCIICGHIGYVNALENPHPAMCSLTLMELARGPLEMTQIEFGEFNKRKIWVCKKHKDLEIKEKISELI